MFSANSEVARNTEITELERSGKLVLRGFPLRRRGTESSSAVSDGFIRVSRRPHSP
jgi:hypothetical protein